MVGGVFRNHWGVFLWGFASHIGSGSITEAELLAILVGAKLAVLKGFSRIIVESDSLVAVKLINKGCSLLHPAYNLVKDIVDALSLLEEFSVVHTLREGNQPADCFAKFGLSLSFCSRSFSNIPIFASFPLREDLEGVSLPRGF